jgi:hypothetical protein
VVAWIALGAGVLSLVSRIWNSWFKSATQLADGDLKVSDVIFFLPASLGFSLSLVVFGVLMIRGAMPTWLGVVWILCGVMFWLGFLPLWFFVAALVFGIRGLLRFRAGRATAGQVSAQRQPGIADGAALA